MFTIAQLVLGIVGLLMLRSGGRAFVWAMIAVGVGAATTWQATSDAGIAARFAAIAAVALSMAITRLLAPRSAVLASTAEGSSSSDQSAPDKDQLRRRTRQLEGMVRLGQHALVADHVNDLFDEAVTLVRETLRARYSAILEPDPHSGLLSLAVGSGWPDDATGATIARRPPIPITSELIVDVVRHPMFEDVALIRDLGVRSGAMVRIARDADQPLFLAVFEANDRQFSDEDLRFLESVANVLSATMGKQWIASALQTAERSVQTVLTSVPIVFWAWDKDGTFTLSQGKGLERLGLKPGEVVGQSVFDVYAEMPDLLNHARRALAGDAFDAVVDLGQSAWDVRYQPVRNDHGQVTGVLGVALDVTERRRAEQNVDRIFALSQELLCSGSMDGYLTSFNPAFEQTLGWSKEELLARPVIEFVHPEDREITRAIFRQLAKGERILRFEHRVECKSAGYRWLSWMVTPVAEEGVVFGSARDVTETKVSQQALRSSEEKFAKAFHSNPTLMAITRLQDGRFIEVNDSYLEVFGYTREEVLGSTTLELGIWSHPEERAAIVEELRLKGRVYQQEVEYFAKDGVACHGLLSAEAIVLGGTEYVLALIHDITERKRAEEALARSESDYRNLVDHAAYGIYRSTEAGQFLSVNPALASMLGYDDVDDLMGVDMARDLYVDASERRRLIDLYHERDRIASVEVGWRRKDGGQITVRLSGRPLKTEGEADLQFEMFVEDVTERRVLEAQLQQAQKMEALGQLTGGIAHDFNNVLTAVLGSAEILGAELPDEYANLQAEVSEIRSGARRGAAMIRKLLTFSRREKLELVSVDPDQVCRETASMLRRLLPKNIDIVVSPGGTGVRTMADKGALEQVLVNLVTNARDAMPEGGTLRVETGLTAFDELEVARHGGRDAGGYVWIAVTDTGIGMDRETLARIFEPFFTTKPRGRGTGLGMAMVYGLVKRHGGFIRIDSDPNSGTTIRMYLPSADAVQERMESDEHAGAPGGSETILLVEDEEAIRTMAERILRRYGYAVVTAEDGDEALQILRDGTSDVDLVVSDVIMPKVSGGELYRRVQEGRSQPPFLFTTGYPADEVEVADLRHEEVPLLQKPWTAEELVRSVRGVLDDRGSGT